MPYSDRRDVPTFRLGATYGKWHFGAVHLGDTRVDATATDDTRYAQGFRGCAKDALCAHFQGRGRSYGLFATYDVAQYRGFSLEAGTAYLRTSWAEKWSDTFPVSTGFSGSAAAARTHFVPVFGVRYEFGPTFSVSTSTFFHVDTGGKQLPQYPSGTVTTLDFTFSF